MTDATSPDGSEGWVWKNANFTLTSRSEQVFAMSVNPVSDEQFRRGQLVRKSCFS